MLPLSTFLHPNFYTPFHLILPLFSTLHPLLLLILTPTHSLVCFCLGVVRLETDLEHPIAQRVPVQRLDRHDRLIVVGHRDKPKALALVRLQILDHLHRLHGPERSEQLPQHVLLRLGRQVVHKDAPARPVDRVRGQHRVAEDVAGEGREPNRGGIETSVLERETDNERRTIGMGHIYYTTTEHGLLT